MSSSASPALPVKDFLSILDISTSELQRMLELAARVKADRRMGVRAPTAQALAGTHVAMLFEKPSLRTRSTFEIGIRELGGEILDLPREFGEGTREPLEDVARNLERWVRALVIRTFAHEKAQIFAGATKGLHVINALSDAEHPCQALADMLTLQERWGMCRGRILAYVGDGNNVATSLAQAAVMMGMHVHIASPEGYALPERVQQQIAQLARDDGSLSLFTRPADAVKGADAVYTDVWTSMGQEDEARERTRAFAGYQVDERMMALAGPEAIFMHCLPAHRGEEVAAAVMDGPQSVIFDQAENRLHGQKAILTMLF